MTLTSTRSMISVISLWGSIAAGQAYADCSNLVLKMQDPVSKREMTSIFNCHEPSLSVPGATTVHFFEWKGGKLCRNIQICGNTQFWNVNVTIGGSYYWGSQVSKLTETVQSWSSFVQNAYSNSAASSSSASEGNYHCTSGSRYQEWQNAGYVDLNAGYHYDEEKIKGYFAIHPEERDQFFGLVGSGAIKKTRRGYYFDAAVGESWAEKLGVSDSSLACGFTNSQWSQSSASTDSGVIGLQNGEVVSKSRLTSDWDVSGIYGSVSLDFGEIKRYCSVTQDLGCF